MDLQEEEDHFSPQVTITSSSSSSSLTLCLSPLLLARLGSARPGSARFHRDQDTHRPGTGPEGRDRTGTCRIRVPAAGSRHAGHGEDGRARGSGLERILQRGGRSHSARLTVTVRAWTRAEQSGSGPDESKFKRKIQVKSEKVRMCLELEELCSC